MTEFDFTDTDTDADTDADTATGAAVLFIPGSFSTQLAWRSLLHYLPGQYRTITTSLLGFGATHDTRTVTDFGMDHQVALIHAVIARIDAPVHLVGHSFGGAVALATALAGRADIRSISTFEANPLGMLRERGRDDLYQQARQLCDRFEAALGVGEADAPGQIIDFWDGPGTFAALPKPVQDYCVKTAGVNLLDWYTAFDFAADTSDFSTLVIPTLVVRSEMSNPLMTDITAALSETLPDAVAAVVPGAGHSLIISHGAECADLLHAQLTRYC